ELAFSWTNYANESVSSGISVFPAVLTGGLYTAASQLTLPLPEGKGQQPFYCRARHSEGDRYLEVVNPGPVDATPAVSIHPPSREDFEGPYRNSTVLCRVASPRKLPFAVQWLKNGAPQDTDVATEGPVSDGRGGYVTNSGISVSQSDWDAGTVYTCKVDAELRNTSKALECGFERPLETEIVVRAVAPAFADIFIDKVAKLTCRVTNLPSAEGLTITWRKETGQELETKTLPRVLQPNGLYSVDGVASVCADEWDKGELYTCRVTHPDLLFPVEEKLQKKTDSSAKAPSIYVFSPPTEQLSMHEMATVTCLVKGFNPPDLLVRWLRNGEPVAAGDYVTLPPVAEGQPPRSYFTYSALSVSGEDWGAGNVYTCLVGHEKLPLQVAQKSVDKSSAYLDGFLEAEEEDLNNLWTTASTFIVLFILSLFYSATVTLIKVK
uniref:Ig-like domain-containing protein n=1 Tax=Apteryx owenii TaxID=8824 RepID=A0A8B9PHK3_APTOW